MNVSAKKKVLSIRYHHALNRNWLYYQLSEQHILKSEIEPPQRREKLACEHTCIFNRSFLGFTGEDKTLKKETQILNLTRFFNIYLGLDCNSIY